MLLVASIESGERDRLAKKFGVPHDRLVLSLTDLCTLLAITPNTLRDWDRQGLPCLQRGQKSPRQNWVYDIYAVIEWMCERARQAGHEAAMKKAGSSIPGPTGAPDGMGPRDGEDIVDYRTRLAKMHEAEIKTALSAKQVVRVRDVVDVFTAHLADAKTTLQSVKGRVMAYLDKLGVPLVESERIVGNVIDDACAKFANANPLRSPLDVTAEDEDDPVGDVPDPAIDVDDPTPVEKEGPDDDGGA